MEFDVPLVSRGFVRRRAISLATSLSVMATSFALAQDPKHGSEDRRVTDADEQQFLFEIDLAMSNMNRRMLMTPTGEIDRDFVNVMVPHHQGAIDMARAEIKYGRNDELRQLARRMMSEQKEEISSLRHALPAVARLAPSTGAEIASHAPN
ncbi:DUF305 domain-containing protein [Bradyrhizobium betae]|uniref:DUF305 domain-containing protein n=1 Tax=Bradyrhizobium betae TaxID=244734 RepID=A0A4Q1UPJ9_9BRAD|nr:DUF305 domain-containing protein [Bradyrhizobium betae]RXT37791.1 hypothetical protein B5V03_31550 [Bradyrhizobium betae]